MRIVRFLKDMGGYTTGNGQMYDDAFADDLVKKGIAEYADVPKPKVEKKMPEQESYKSVQKRVIKDLQDEDEKKKALDKPVKDKMIRSPSVKKKK
jgi:hypothetical protein